MHPNTSGWKSTCPPCYCQLCKIKIFGRSVVSGCMQFISFIKIRSVVLEFNHINKQALSLPYAIVLETNRSGTNDSKEESDQSDPCLCFTDPLFISVESGLCVVTGSRSPVNLRVTTRPQTHVGCQLSLDGSSFHSKQMFTSSSIS
jgi:hypothetical protein